MVEPYLNQVGGKITDDVSLFTDGLNTYTDKAFLEANAIPYVMNMTMERPPQIRTRRGRQTIAQFMEGKKWRESIGEIIDLWAYDEYQIFAIVAKGSARKLVQIYREYNDVTFQYGADYKVKEYEVTIGDEPKYYFTLAKTGTANYLYVTGLTFKVKVTISTNPLSTDPEPVADGHYGMCCYHKGRLFLGMPGSNIITFSALGDFDNFAEMVQYQVVTSPLDMADPTIVYLMQNVGATNLWDKYVWDETQSTFVLDGTIAKTELVIDTTTGLSIPDYSVIAGDFQVTNSRGRLISLKSFDDKLMIFCEHSLHCVYGDTPDTSMQNQFQLVDLNNNLGAVSDRCIAIGGGRLFWLGDNQEVYEYTGASTNIISRPGKTRNSTLSLGGISGLIETKDIHEGTPVDTGLSTSKFVATSEALYINVWNAHRGAKFEKLVFVFDIYNRVWWCEDGEFNTIGNFSDHTNRIILGTEGGDILISNSLRGSDEVYEFSNEQIVKKPIEYEFHTRVYGADGTDSRKTLSKVWFQARAEADVYINDIWTSLDEWNLDAGVQSNFVKVDSLKSVIQPPTQPTKYRSDTYEQQQCIVPKLYGERLNAFQIIVKGVGDAIFYLMKREWRAR